MDTNKPDNTNENEMGGGLNRRSALKKILGSTGVILGFPLSVSAWGQPSSPFGATSSMKSSSQMHNSSAPIAGMEQSLMTLAPTSAPIDCEYLPTSAPSVQPPTEPPVVAPTDSPTQSPLVAPTDSPTQSPLVAPTESPTQSPLAAPTESPTQSPLPAPTQSPLPAPTQSPTASPITLGF